MADEQGGDLVFWILLILCLSPVVWWGTHVALIALAGIERSRKPKNDPDPPSKRPPKISVLVAAKNEEKVIKRLLDVLIALDYPPDKKEILVVEDGSTDRTAEICQEYAKKHPRLVKFFHQEKSNGKPAAVNFIARKASGEVVGVFDADSVPEPDVLRKVASYFSDPQTVAVQGLIHPINARENLLTRVAAADQAFLNAVQRGKNRFSLFVQAIGPCFFIRKEALKRLEYWNENSLVEDIDLAVRLIREGKGVELAKDIGCWQECPPSLKCFVQQRLRWYRGILETAFEHSFSIIKFNRRAYDAFITLASPIVNTLALFGFLVFICSFFISLPFGPLPFTFVALLLAYTMFVLSASALVLCFRKGYLELRNLKEVPLFYACSVLSSLMSFFAMFCIAVRRPKSWFKTGRSGVVAPA